MQGENVHCGPLARVFSAGDLGDLAHEVGVARGAQADVVREDGRAEQVAVAVHGVDAVEQRDLQPRLERCALELVDHVGPRLRVLPAAGVEPPPDRTEPSA